MDYTPDFQIGNVIIEAKGRFDASNRVKAIAFKEQYPQFVYAMCFDEYNKLSKASKTRYTEWCMKQSIPAAVGLITPDWLLELSGFTSQAP